IDGHAGRPDYEVVGERVAVRVGGAGVVAQELARGGGGRGRAGEGGRVVDRRLGALLVAEVDAEDDLATADGDLVGVGGRGRLGPTRLRFLGHGVGAGGEVGEGVVAVGVGDGEALAGVTAAVAVVVEV